MRPLLDPAVLAIALHLAAQAAHSQTLPDPAICEDSIDGQPPFNSNDVPCLLGCGSQITQATGSLLPGSVNLTEIPYCQLDCVRSGASPAQSSAAPGCYAGCKLKNQATPENIGWCMYWCVDGYADLVTTTACVPSLEYVPVATSLVGSDLTVTIDVFSQPSAWLSWYQTQTVISRTGDFAATITPAATTTKTSPTTTGPSSTAAGNSASGSLTGSSGNLDSAGATGVASDVAGSSSSGVAATTSKSGSVMVIANQKLWLQGLIGSCVVMFMIS
ncbi:hypothetical protein BX600DRAFT_461990 [Xylariales sp. PMI_506]|nr:hypothetical protein BX600DRAFT_461990 [Xylariales sp. PMI_506]